MGSCGRPKGLRQSREIDRSRPVRSELMSCDSKIARWDKRWSADDSLLPPQITLRHPLCDTGLAPTS